MGVGQTARNGGHRACAQHNAPNTVVAIIGDKWTGATRSPAYDFDAQYWLTPVHCLWLYHAARLGRPTDESANGYASLDASGKESSEAQSLAVAFLSSRPMLHLGELSYGIYICQLGAFQTIAWLHNLDKPSSMKPASWLNHDAASWGTFNLEAVSLVEVLALLLDKQQGENLQIVDVHTAAVIHIPKTDFLTPAAFIFLYENQVRRSAARAGGTAHLRRRHAAVGLQRREHHLGKVARA